MTAYVIVSLSAIWDRTVFAHLLPRRGLREKNGGKSSKHSELKKPKNFVLLCLLTLT